MRTRITAIVLALGVVLAGCGGHSAIITSSATAPTSQGALVFQGNFTDPSQQWPTTSSASGSQFISGDTYTMQFRTAGSFDAFPTIATVEPQFLADVSVSVDVTPTSTRPGDRFGVLCRAVTGPSESHSYAFLVGPGASGQLAWAIELRKPLGVRTLANGTTAAPTTSPYALRADCINGGAGHQPVVLALYLGGNLVGEAQDAKLPAPYVGLPGLTASSTSGGTSVNFSNMQVRAASAS